MGRDRILLQTYQVLADPNPHSVEPPTTTSSANKMPSTLHNQNLNEQTFDSSIGLTILVLLSALFFMGFFSIYIRRFANDSPVDLSRSRRWLRSSRNSTNTTTLPNVTRLCGTRKGLDFDSIQALPVVKFSALGLVGVVDCCAVCLAEFEEGESVKMLPTCQHLFHVECIDTWLVARASCPVCRTTKILKEEERVEAVAVASGGVRRCCSSSEIDVVVVAEEEESGSEQSRRGGLLRTRSF